jgi:tRNA(Ile)-lysidine synthase
LEHGLNYVEDSSNAKDDYTRNYIRNQLIPQISQFYLNATQNVLSTVDRLKEADEIITETVDLFWKKALRKYKGIDCVDIAQWLKVAHYETYTWGLIKSLGFRSQQIGEVHKLLTASTGAYIVTNTHKLVKYKNMIQLVPLSTSMEHQLIYGEGVLQLSHFAIQVEAITRDALGVIPTDKKIACVDADALAWPLLIRSWQPTDYFYPLGINKKKKLNHFLGATEIKPGRKRKANRYCIW